MKTSLPLSMLLKATLLSPSKFKKISYLLFFSSFVLLQSLNAQQCSENTSVNGIAGTGFSNGTIGQSFTACADGKLASVSVQAGNAGVGFNNVIVQIFSGDGFGGTVLATSGQVHVKANRTTTWNLSSFNIQVVSGQKYTARFLTQSGTPMMAYGTGANAAIDYYPRGRIYGAAQAHNDMFFSAVIETLSDPTKTPEDDAVDVTRDTQVKLDFSRSMEAISGNITINNVTDASSQTVDVTTLTIDGTEVLMPLNIPLEGGKDFEIIIPANTLRSTNQIPFPGLAAGEWTFSTSTKPFASLSTTSADLTNDAVFPFTIDFSDVVTGFALSDFVVTNGTASNLAGSGASYTFDVTPTADGEVEVSLPPNVVEAGASNGNDSTGYVLEYDGTAPSVELRTMAMGTIQTSIFDIEVVFDEPVTGFETTDLQIVNADVLSSTNTNDSLFTVSLRAQAEGQITVDLAASIADDLAGNANTAAPAIIDVTFSVDLESNLLSFYPFDGNANDTVSTGFNGTVSGALLTSGFDGGSNSAYAFDGSDDMTFGDTPIGSGSFTVAFWVKIPEGLPQNQLRTIISKRASCGEGRFFEINYNNSSTNGHQISVEQRNNTGVANPSAVLSAVGEWTHIAYVKDNGQQQSSFYINGVQQTPVAWTSTYNFENNASLKAGISACNGNGRFRYQGDLDDIHVYGRALTSVEIDLLVPFTIRSLSAESGADIQAGQQIELTLNKNVVGSSVNTTNITASGSVSGAVAINVSSTDDKVTVVAPSGWPLDEDVTISLSGLLAENGTTLPATDLTYSVIADEAVGLILHYPISGNVNEAIGNIAGQDGTPSGTLFVEGADGDPFGALSFDGSNDLVTLGDAPISTESFSISMLVKVPTDGSETINTVILSKREACTEGRLFDISYRRLGDKVRFAAGMRNNANVGTVATGFDFPVDQWTRITLVKDNAAQKNRLIVNGVLEGELQWAGSVNLENNAPIRLGNTPCNGVDGTLRFDGLMDDVRIYDRVIEPRVLSIEPSRNTVNAKVDTVVTITFDRAIDVSSLDATTVSITDIDATTYPFTTAFSNGDSVLTITPDNNLPKGKQLTVSVDTLSAQIGSDFLPFETSFTTVFTQLLSFAPSNGLSNVDSLETIAFKFDNSMDMATLDQGIQIIGSHQGPVEGTFSMPTTDSVVFTPSSYYFANEKITVTLTPELKDVGGASIGNTRAFKFHVKSGDYPGTTLSYELHQLSTTGTISSPRELVPVDMDNDGDLDLIGSDDGSRRLLFFENLGSGNYGTGQTIASGKGYFDVKVTDFDFDGDADVVTADRSVAQGIYWHENDGSGNFSEHLIKSLPGADSRSISVADFNKDGELDVAVASIGSNRFHAFERDGTQLFAAANASQPIFIEEADWNGDGNMDIIAGNFGGSIVRWTNSGLGTFSGFTIHSVAQLRSVTVIDIDQDGDQDIVYSSQSGNQIGVLENDGVGNFTNVQVGSVVTPHRIDVGDADGDGDLDIIYTNIGSGADVNFYYLENSGSLTLWVSNKLISTATFGSTFTQTAKFADVDNDGDLDVVATNANSGFYVFENKIVDLNEPPIISNPIADQAINEDDANGLSIDVSNVFVDNDGDSFTLSASSDNVAVTAAINGNNLELDIATADFNGDVNITVTADDGNGTNDDVFVLTVTPVNDAPAFDISTATISVDEDFTTTETITVTQNQPADEDAPTYSVARVSGTPVDAPLVADVSVDGTTGEVTITALADAFGSQEYTITADDGGASNSTATQNFTVVVAGVNDAPVVANAIADVALDEDPAVNGRVVLTNAFSDADGEALTLGITVTSGGDLAAVTLDAETINIAPEEDAFGTIQIEVSAEDAAGQSVTDVFDVVINPINDAPAFTVSGNLSLQTDFTGTETVTVTADAVAFGEDAQVVTYSLSPASVTFANVSINSTTGEVSVTAVAGGAGTQEFTITADDGEAENNTATQTFTLTVIDNAAPEVANEILDTTINEDQATLTIVDVTTVFTDAENDPLTYAVTDDFGGAVSVIITTGSKGTAGNLLQVTPTANYFGMGTITLTASDANQSTSTSFNLTVNSVNDAPTASSEVLADVTANEDEAVSITLSASLFEDVEGDAITLSTGSTPAWLSFDGTVLSGTPGNSDVGVSTIEVTGDDGNGGSATRTFQLTVQNVNDAPTVVNAVADFTVSEDADATVIDLASIFEDVDAGDAISITAATAAETLISLGLANDELTITYAADASGTATVTVTATDMSGATATDEFLVTVSSVNDAPVFTLSDNEVEQEADFAGTVTVEITAGAVPADEADQAVTYTLSSDDTDIVTATINGTSIEFTAIAEAFGEQTFTVTADDGQAENNVHAETIVVTVNRILSADAIENSLRVYPNPVVRTLMFNKSSELDVKVISLDGKLIMHKKVNGSLNVESLEKGTYFIQTNDGEEVTTHRIIKAN